MTVETGVVDGYLTKEETEYFQSGGSKEPENLEAEVQEEVVEEQSTPDESQENDTEIQEEVEETQEEPTTAEDDGIESDDEPQPTKKRDLEKAFKTERHKRKEMREKLEANEARTRELESRLAELQQSLQTKQNQVPEVKENVPDPEDDPLGYQQYKINKLEEAIQNQSKYLQQQHEVAQRSHSENAFRTHYEAKAKEFSQKQPDFMDAYSFLMGARLQEHLAAGFTQEQAQQLLIEDEIAVASLAFKQQVNPAERIYSIAKARGYVPGKNKPQAKTASIDSIKKGMDNAKSLKSGGGELPNRMAGVDEIEGMTFDEFDKFWAGYKNKARGAR